MPSSNFLERGQTDGPEGPNFPVLSMPADIFSEMKMGVLVPKLTEYERDLIAIDPADRMKTNKMDLFCRQAIIEALVEGQGTADTSVVYRNLQAQDFHVSPEKFRAACEEVSLLIAPHASTIH